MSGNDTPPPPRRAKGRPRAPITADQRQLLARLAAARNTKEQAERDYLDAFRAAADSGVTQSAIARTLGITDEAVGQTIRRYKQQR